MSFQEEFNDAADEWFALGPADYPRMPRPAGDGVIAIRQVVALPILDTPGFQERPDAIKAALVILSQSPTARKMALTAIEQGYSIFVDPPSISGAGPEYEEGSSGSTDHANKRINLRGGDDPLRMAMILAHELAHVSQIVDGELDMRVSALHPLSAIRQLMAMEGDARAYEFLVASELTLRTMDDPPERLLFTDALDMAADTIGVSFGKRVVELAKPALAAGGAPGKWMAAIFKCLYASPELREHYESTILHGIETLEKENPGSLKDPALFRGEVTAAALIDSIDRHGTPYLARAGTAYIDLDDPQMAGISLKARTKLEAFETLRHENPATQNDETWKGAVFQLVTASAPQQKPLAPRQGPPAP